MVQAEWLNEKWEVTDERNRLIKSFSVSKSIKTKTDSDTQSTKITGTNLSQVQLVFNTAVTNGGNPRKEFNELQQKVGKTGTLCIGTYAIGGDHVLLDSVRIQSQAVDNNGFILYADIECNFVEVSKPSTKSDLSTSIDGTDITPDSAIEKCILEEYAEGHADVLELKFSDPYQEWGKWSKEDEMHGLKLKVKDGAAESGTMFIHSVKPQGKYFVVRGMSVPDTVFKETSKSWESVTLEKIAEEIASKHGLSFKNYDTKGITRDYVRQDTENDFEFLHKRCKLEGASFLVYNETLSLYDEKALEAGSATKTIDIDDLHVAFTPDENTEKQVKTMNVVNGEYKGTYTADGVTNTVEKTYRISETVADQSAINDIAQAFCRNDNKRCMSAVIKTDFIKEIAAGSVIELKSKKIPQWACKVFVYFVRHDYVKHESGIYVRKPLSY